MLYIKVVKDGGGMKKIAAILVLAVFLTGSTLLFAAEAKRPGSPGASPAPQAKKTVFNSLSDFFSTFDRPFTRPGNKEGFWNATASWVRNINKD